MTLVWADIRSADAELVSAVRESAVHARVTAIVDSDADRLGELPPTVLKVYAGQDASDWSHGGQPVEPGAVRSDLVMLPVTRQAELDRAEQLGPAYVPTILVTDQASLELACRSALSCQRTVVSFADPTKIPLEIVIAAADKTTGEVICSVSDVQEASIVLGVLEKGSEGVMVAATSPSMVTDLIAAVTTGHPPLALTSLVVQETSHVGLGDRVCVDTCSQFQPDEGMLVGSFAHGFILCCSETHPLPYMPTRPFRVNAGALHSYVLLGANRTSYLSELRSGKPVLAVRADGHVRTLVVGRAKLERRPLMQITAVSEMGQQVCLTVQDDWHVRVLAPGGGVLNVTELTTGSQVLGYLATDRRHVGYPIDEFCVEQ